MAIRIMITFAITGIAGSVLGSFIDNKLETGKLFSVGLLPVFYVITWFEIYRVYKNHMKDMNKNETVVPDAESLDQSNT